MQYFSVSSSSTGEKRQSNLYFDLYLVLIIVCHPEEGCVLMMDEIVPTSRNMFDAQNDAT